MRRTEVLGPIHARDRVRVLTQVIDLLCVELESTKLLQSREQLVKCMYALSDRSVQPSTECAFIVCEGAS